ncbi:MAG: T9SS type A sorting domain-containing protein [Calditrichaceae bacterium]|nr:T9SS type A sorting domain-containing protein [Calditrichaceae bacterium]MBN2709813.1 T9SS type A sorting domain-containing protein [Calditrichaceae bacterium]
MVVKKGLLTVFLYVFFMFSGLLAEVAEKDSLALIALYDSTAGASWTNVWNLNNEVNTWHGVTVKNKRVISLNLYNNNLNGVLPKELGDLDSLGYLRIGNDEINGALPDGIWQLKNLYYIYIGSTDITGSIPPEIQNLKDLKDLYLVSSQFSGNIPSEIGQSSKLETLRLSNNSFDGSIPEELQNCTNLKDIYIGYNNFSGSFPTFLTELTEIIMLGLSHNNFEGPIPSEIGNMTNLKWVYLDNNHFTEGIPPEIGKLTKATYLQLNNNDMDGTIPDEICQMSSLSFLRLNDNNFTGALPDSITKLTSLNEIDIRYNQIDNLPDLSTVASLEDLHVEYNRLDFGDLEPQLNSTSITDFTYIYQDSLGEAEVRNLKEGSSSELVASSGGTVTHYQWYKNNSPIGGAEDSALTLSDLTLMDSGLYFCEITNDSFPGFSIFTHGIRLNVCQAVITEDTEWSGIVNLYADLFIPDTVTLTILPKTKVLFHDHIKIKVKGRILAQGTIEDSIWFEAGEEGINWAGIRFDTLNVEVKPSLFQYCVFQDGGPQIFKGRPPTIEGGAFSIRSSNQVRISNSTFQYNEATYGAALFIEDSNILLEWNTFTENEASFGGAVFLRNDTILIRNSKFYRNNAGKNGGAIYTSETQLEMQNSLLAVNYAGYGGALSYTYSNIFSTNNTFADNEAVLLGGAVYNTYSENVIYTNNIFWNNKADSLSNQFYFVKSDSAEFYYCLFEGDSSDFTGDKPVLTYENNISGDPLFSHETGCEYMLQEGSPALDAGTPDTSSLGLPATDLAGNERIQYGRIDIGAYEKGESVEISQNKALLPTENKLLANYPNPFNPMTTIAYDLVNREHVHLAIYNTLGQKVRVLVDEAQNAGRHNVNFTANGIASGIYFYVLSTKSGFVQIKKMALIK